MQSGAIFFAGIFDDKEKRTGAKFQHFLTDQIAPNTQ